MEYKIPLFDLNYGKEEEEAILAVLRSKWISMGEKVASFEEKFAKHLGVKEAVALTNCTVGLHLSLQILGIGVGDEVLVPSLTFVATANAIRYLGAVPVFCDIVGYEDFSICPKEIESKTTSKSKAILVMHYGGFGCPMDQICDLAKKYNLYVVEDSAHAPNGDYQGKKLGTWGDLSCFSFFSNKNMTCAEGGLVGTNRADLASQLKLLRSHGMTSLSYERAKGHATSYDVIRLGYNFRIDDLRGALLLSQLKKLSKDTKKREELRQYYVSQLKEMKEIIVPYQNYKGQSSNYVFPILLKKSTSKKRDQIRDYLAKDGIQTSVHYPAVHEFSIYKEYSTSLPKTEYVTRNEITLPLYFHLEKKQIDAVVDSLQKAVHRFL